MTRELRRRAWPAALLGLSLLPRISAAEPGSDAGAGRATSAGSEVRAGPKREAAAQARELYVEGTRHVEAGAFDQALVAYRRSYELYPSASTLVNLAHCEGRLGHLVEAWVLLLQALAPAGGDTAHPLSPERFAAADAERRRLEARIPSLMFHGPGGAELRIGGKELQAVPGSATAHRLSTATGGWTALPAGARIHLNPGSYRVEGRWHGQESTQEVELAEGDVLTLNLPTRPPAPASAPFVVAPSPARAVFEPSAAATPAFPPSPSPLRALAVGSLIGGGVAFTAALVAAGVMLDAESTLAEECPPSHVCPAELEGTVSRYRTAATITNVGLITGVTATAAGVGFLVAERASARRGLSVQAAATSLRVRVRF